MAFSVSIQSIEGERGEDVQDILISEGENGLQWVFSARVGKGYQRSVLPGTNILPSQWLVIFLPMTKDNTSYEMRMRYEPKSFSSVW